MFEVGTLSFKNGQATYQYEWEIDNFSHYKNSDTTTCLKSPVFSTPPCNHAQPWQLLFHPEVEDNKIFRYWSLSLQYFGRNYVAASANFSHRFGDVRNFEQKSMENQLFGPQRAIYSIEKFLKHKDLLGSNEVIQLSCRISFHPPLAGIPKTVPLAVPHVYETDGLPEDNSEEDHRNDFDTLFETELFGDVTVNIGQKKKSLHKAILVSRSDYFRAMFEHDMSEKKNNDVNVVDISLDVATEMFRYMYTGKVNNLETLPVDELLIAANTYAITGLKAMCEKTLVKDLDVDNALQYLTLAILHNSPNLKTKVIEFIAKHLDKFVDNPQFKTLDRDVVSEIFSMVAKYKY